MARNDICDKGQLLTQAGSDPRLLTPDARRPRVAPERLELWLSRAFAATLVARLLFPFYDSPLDHLFSDPGLHWLSGRDFLHPNMNGSGDPILYQLWLFLLQMAAQGSSAFILTGCGFLCAAMPYGWYRALKELLPKGWALAGALVIAVTPEFFAIYAYFMTETLILALTGFAFWFTFRAQRKRAVGAFALACTLWLCALFTRVIAAPIALGCLLALWLPQPRKLAKGLVGIVLLLVFTIPAGLHARLGLHYFAPFGNLYTNEIYVSSGMHDITVQFGPEESWYAGSPSFYNPTFYPFSDWTTDRVGTFAIVIDPALGSASWASENGRAARENKFPAWRKHWENALYLLFGQAWPDNDLGSLSGWLTVWSRWLWPAVFAAVACGALMRWFRGREWLLPASALGMLLFLAVQNTGVMEARFRTPIDPIFLAAVVVMTRRYSVLRQSGILDGKGSCRESPLRSTLG